MAINSQQEGNSTNHLSLSEQDEQIDPVNQSIESIANLHLHMERKVDSHQRAIEKVTAFLGRPLFLYIILFFVMLWISANILLVSIGWKSFDPAPFNWLLEAISLGSLLMTTVVLITQRRQDKAAEQRRQLDLQVNLIVEQKVTKLIELVEELRQDLPSVKDRHDPEAEALKKAVDPHETLATFNQVLEEAAEEDG